MHLTPPTYDNILAARDRIADAIVWTPLLRFDHDGRELWLKAEVLQRTGSFKIRGALNFIAALAPEIREQGVVSFSSGSHAQGVASAAAEFGVPATIVMPSDAPEIKIRNTKNSGAKVVPYDRAGEDREAIAASIAAETGALVLPPFDHSLTIAGQGVIGLEIVEDLESRGVEAASVVVPTSGGGLAAGIVLVAERSPMAIDVLVAEPRAYDDHRQSLAAGKRVRVATDEPSICDAALQPIPGEITFDVNRDRLAGAVVATDNEVLAAMRFAFEKAKLVVEPGGALALAAFLAGQVPGDGPVVAVLSGGNVDPAVMERALRI